MTETMPEPTCKLGYTAADLHALLGDRFAAFSSWMRGQTAAVCDGRSYNHSTQEYEATGCGPHGTAIYPSDVRQFLSRGPVLD